MIQTMSTQDVNIFELRRRVRVVQLMEAAEAAGLTPIPLLSFHAFAYLGDVLSPIWNLTPPNGKVLKRRGGPFYPELQTEIDRLTASFVLEAFDLSHEQDEAGRWRLEASYGLDPSYGEQVLHRCEIFRDERAVNRYVRELALAIAHLGPSVFRDVIKKDVTYANPEHGPGAVIDFAEWRQANSSASAVNSFKTFVDDNAHLSSGESLNLYARFLGRDRHVR